MEGSESNDGGEGDTSDNDDSTGCCNGDGSLT